MKENKIELKTNEAVEVLKAGLKYLNLTTKELSLKSNIPLETIEGILNLEMPITYDIACELTSVIGGRPETWIALQN